MWSILIILFLYSGIFIINILKYYELCRDLKWLIKNSLIISKPSFIRQQHIFTK